MSRPSTVYLIYGADDTLLYVGASVAALTRLGAHRRKDWFSEAARVELRHFDTEDDALEAEEVLIADLHPRHNVTGRVWTDPEYREEHERRLAERRANLAALDERARQRYGTAA